MKRVLVNSVIVAAMATTSIIACTKGAKDRTLKGGGAPAAAGVDKAKAEAEAKAKAAEGTGRGDPAKPPAPPAEGTIPVTQGFLDLKDVKEAAEAAKSVVVIGVPVAAEPMNADNFLNKYSPKPATTVEEAIEVLKEMKGLGDNFAGQGDVLRETEKQMAILQLEVCKGKELRDCTIHISKRTYQSGFLVAGKKVLTTAAFLVDYVKSVLMNSDEYKKLTKPSDQIAFLKKSNLKVIISNDDKVFSTGTEMVATLEDVSEKAMEMINKGTYASENLKPADAKVTIKLDSKGDLPALKMSTFSCDAASKEKDAQALIVGYSSETTNRDKKAENRFEAVNGKLQVGKGPLVKTLDMQKYKSLLSIADLGGITISAADTAKGYEGAPILNSKGEYIGIHTSKIKQGLSIGACLTK